MQSGVYKAAARPARAHNPGKPRAQDAAAGSAARASACESGARPIALSPLSAYSTAPVTAEASGLSRNAAAAPTSLAASSFCTGAFAYEYLCRGVRARQRAVLSARPAPSMWSAPPAPRSRPAAPRPRLAARRVPGASASARRAGARPRPRWHGCSAGRS